MVRFGRPEAADFKLSETGLGAFRAGCFFPFHFNC